MTSLGGDCGGDLDIDGLALDFLRLLEDFLSGTRPCPDFFLADRERDLSPFAASRPAAICLSESDWNIWTSC